MSSKDKHKLSVPKFSFKPKSNGDNEKVVGENPSKPDESERDKRAGSHRSPTADVSRHGRDVKDELSCGKRSEASGRPPVPLVPSSTSVFIVDKRGDPLIRKYGSNHRYDIPSYRRYGSGRIMGADGYLRIERVGNREEFFIRGYHEGGSVMSGRKSALAKAGRNSSKPVRVRVNRTKTFTGTEDFLPFRGSKKRKRGASQSSASSDEGPSYRSIHGKSKPNAHSDSEEVYESDSSVSSTSASQRVIDPVNAKSIELSRRVKEHPQDIDAWLELVDHQDILLQMNESYDRKATQAEIKSNADIKLSLLEKALTHAERLDQKEKLRLRIMREGSKTWDPKTLGKRWEDVMKDHGSSFEIWKGYANFRQTNLLTLRYDDIKELYIKKLRSVENRISDAGTDSSTQDALYAQLVAVFLKTTRFVADAGFSELAVAAWQATLELNFSRPPTPPSPDGNLIPPSFQDFWESEVARIGEDSAKGWAAFVESNGSEDVPDPKSFITREPRNTRDAYKAWAASEEERATNSKIPARTLDDGTEDDPFRVVMYADIQEFLSFVPSEALPVLQPTLLDAFLTFCQLPPALGSTVLRDDLLNNSGDALFSIETSVRLNRESEDAFSKPPQFDFNCQKFANSRDTLLPPSQWFRYIQSRRQVLTPDQFKLVSNVLKHLARSSGLSNLATYYLAFESSDEKDGKKTAKALLKQNAANVELYIGYANYEFSRGNKTAARNVVAAALGLPSISAHDRLCLCIAWTWLELEDGDFVRGTCRLCLAPEDAPNEDSAAPSQVLKTRQLLASNSDYLISRGDSDKAITYTEGLALLEYMTRQSGKEPQSEGQGDIWSAISSISTCSDELSSRGHAKSSTHERLLQFAARLLYYHVSHGPFRLALLREHLERYISIFPANTIFLSLYAWRETRLSIDDRVRSVLDKTVLVKAHDCLSSRVFAISHEMKAGNVHSARAAFEHALGTDTCRNHTGLWISYIRYCRSQKELRPKAKGIFYRAIQNCPWSKHVFMEAFVTLVTDMDSSELRSVYNTLCEKGLRVHIELDEFVENWKKTQKLKSSSGRR